MEIDPEILYHTLIELSDDDLHYNNIKRKDFAYGNNDILSQSCRIESASVLA